MVSTSGQLHFAPDNCALCPRLAACRTQVVHGTGPHNAPIFMIGQNPGEFEDRDGIPFVGKSGLLLRHLCDAAGIPAEWVYRTNAVRCLSPGNSKPKRAEIENCLPFLLEEISRVQPKVIITLGEVAFEALHGMAGFGNHADDLAAWEQEREEILALWRQEVADWMANHPKGERRPLKPPLPVKPRPGKVQHSALKDVAGHTFQTEEGIPIIPSYHPSFLMRGNWEMATSVVEHFKKAARLVSGRQTSESLGDYFVIDDLEKLQALRDYLLSDEVEVIAYDCETTGVHWMDDEVLCVQFSGAAGEGYTVPILHNPGNGDPPDLHPAWENGCLNTALSLLWDIFASDKPKRGQNQLFDMRMLERDRRAPHIEALTAFGFKVNGRLEDTELVHHSIAEAMPHNMTANLALWTGMPYYEADIKPFKKTMGKAPNADIWRYGAADVDGVHRLWPPMRAQAEAEGVDWVLDNVTMPMLRVCRDIEEAGFLIDRDYFDRLCRFYDLEVAKAEEALWQAVPSRPPGWKYNYPPTLRDVLFKELGLPTSGRKTDGAHGCQDCNDGVCFEHDSTGRDALKDIAVVQPHPVLDILLTLKFLTKRKGTYLDGGRGGFKKHIRADGRIHPSSKISRVETGRLATEEPNSQNIPNYVHLHPFGATCRDATCKAFYPETYGINSTNAFHDMVVALPGHGIMNADWAQLEVWVLAYRLFKHFGNRTLLDVLESGVDIHLWMARKMYPNIDPQMDDKEWREVHSDLRRRAKCMTPGTRILTADLRWAPLSEIKEGDEIMAFDEEISGRRPRRLRKGKVIAAWRAHKELYAVEFDDGTVLKMTEDHPLLCRRRAGGQKANFAWRTLEEGVKRGLKVLPTWDEDTSNSAGWLAGYFDGEGCVTSTPGHGIWSVAAPQVAGTTSDKALRLLEERGFKASRRERGDSLSPRTGAPTGKQEQILEVVGGTSERMRFLGSIRPERLIQNMLKHQEFGRLPGADVEIVRVTPLGLGEVVSLETDTHTFIAEGFAVHNTANFGIGYGLTEQGFMLRERCTQEQAAETIARYKAIVPIDLYFDQIKRDILTQGFTENEFERRRHISVVPLLQAMRQHRDAEALLREAINFPIQAGGSDLHSIVSAATNQSTALRSRGLRTILSIHDSLTFEFDWPDNAYAQETAWMVKDLWQTLAWSIIKRDGSPLEWKVPVEVEWGRSWGSPEWKLDAKGTVQKLTDVPEEDVPAPDEIDLVWVD